MTAPALPPRRVPGWLVLLVATAIIAGLGFVIWNGPNR
jgi:hypothetical protein